MPKRVSKPDIALLRALEFVSIAQRARGGDMERFCRLSLGTCTAFNGVIAAGQRIEEQLQCCPQTDRLIAALEQCDPGYSITHMAQDRLVVQSGQFTAHVPLVDPMQIQPAWPDAKLVNVGDEVKAAMMAVIGVVNDKADRVHESAVLLAPYTATGTNGNVILEGWHGYDLPPGVMLPKSAVAALAKIRKPLAGIGYGNTTVTFWFADNTWMRTQRYLAEWPKSTLFDTATRPTPIPDQLFQASQRLAPFSEDGNLYCWQGKASSHSFAKPNSFNGTIRADVPGIQSSRVYKLSTLTAVAGFATTYDETASRNRTFVYGHSTVKIGSKKSEAIAVKMRGVFSHTTEDQQQETQPLPVVGNMENWNTATLPPISDEDIPF